MQHDTPTPIPPDTNDQLYAAVNRMLAPFGKSVEVQTGVFGGRQPPFSVRRPTEFRTKQEFQRQFDAVTAALQNIDALFEAVLPDRDDPDSEKNYSELTKSINEIMRKPAPRTELENSINLIRRNTADVGGFLVSLHVINDLRTALRERLSDLENQRDQFWNLPYRAPDYFARAIALRLARLYAREVGERPTYGISGETGEPSTNFSRTLRDIFGILDIDAGEKAYAAWAVDRLTDDDLSGKSGAGAPGTVGGLLGLNTGQDDENDLLTATFRSSDTNKANATKTFF